MLVRSHVRKPPSQRQGQGLQLVTAACQGTRRKGGGGCGISFSLPPNPPPSPPFPQGYILPTAVTAPLPVPQGSIAMQKWCWYGVSCRSPVCPFWHGKPCWFADRCRNPFCRFWHGPQRSTQGRLPGWVQGQKGRKGGKAGESGPLEC